MTDHTARPYVLHEATYRQTQELRPNVAVLPWGATEAHNYHLPHGTDVIEATALGEAAVERAHGQGARVVLLPAVPFGNNHTQLTQTATITMRSATQLAVLRDVAESLVRQGIDRLVLINFHGGNDFKPLIRDVMLDVPIYIVLINGYALAPQVHEQLGLAPGGHADEFETSLLLHLRPEWVAPLSEAGQGETTPYQLKSLKAPGVWSPRDWAATTADTGDGDPAAATADKGAAILAALVDVVAPILVEFSAATEGDFPFVIRHPDRPEG